MPNEDWERAGMVASDGLVGRPVPAGQILVPGSITLESDGLSLSWVYSAKSHFVTPDASMLDGFVQLCKRPPSAVVTFAKRWGVLNIGKDNRPCSAHRMGGRESIRAWHFFSGRAMAVLNLIAALKQKKIGDIEDWKALGVTDDSTGERERVSGARKTFPLPQRSYAFPRTPQDASGAIAEEVNAWMAVWKEHRMRAPSDFRVENTGPGLWALQVDFDGSLFPALAFQLCLIAVNADTLYCCSGCGLPYIRPRSGKPRGARRPKPGQANYCAECRELGIPERRASERYRERNANAKTKAR